MSDKETPKIRQLNGGSPILVVVILFAILILTILATIGAFQSSPLILPACLGWGCLGFLSHVLSSLSISIKRKEQKNR